MENRSPDGPWIIKIPPHSPAIWIYPESATKSTHVELELEFKGNGFMTSSTPSYNQRWRIDIDPTVRFNRYSSKYDEVRCPFLDYDGYRDGPFQTSSGWYIAQQDLLSWQREQLKELNFTDSEIDDVNYTYGRSLLERNYPQTHWAIYPQETSIVEQSVSLRAVPNPETVYRLWLYFVPTNHRPANLIEPQVRAVQRMGFTLLELAYLTERELPKGREDRAGRLLGAHIGKERQ